MMQRFGSLFVCLAFLACGSFAADHVMYHNCSLRSFCSNLRNAVPDDDNRFIADIENYDLLHNSDVVIKLKNNAGAVLEMVIHALGDDGAFRFTIAEVNSTRYKLEHSLKEEPQPQTWGYTRFQSDGTLRLMKTSSLPQRISIYGDPFKIEFSYLVGDEYVIQSTLDGSRLIWNSLEDDQSFAFAMTYNNANHLYGLSERSDQIYLQHTADGSIDPYRLKNADNWAYEVNSTMAMYGSIPVVYAFGNLTSGLFLHNAAEQWIEYDDDTKTAYFMVESGTLDFFVLFGPDIKEVVRQYTNLTGVFNLPKLYTLGYHQSRWAYYSADDVQYVIGNFDKYEFPLDVIWLDINYTDYGRYFRWNPDNFSDPIGLLNNMSETNRFLVVLSDPHIKIESNYSVYADALDQDLFVKNPNGTVFVGQCWPGDSSWLDFLNPKTHEYYAGLHSYDNFIATPTLGGMWNDMNEPALFDETIEKTLPFETLHYGGVRHGTIHNIYGHLQTRATYQGLIDRDNGTLRPFILTRAHFAGTQRYAAMWTGDNTSEWPYIGISYSMCITSGLAGMPFCGADIGGFEGAPGEEMLSRWYQAGAWLPFMRAHANIDSQRREPYLFSNETQGYIREAIKLRISHILVWYTLFYEHSLTGDPVIRPLFYHYPDEEEALTVSDQVLVGSDILAKAVSEPEVTSVPVYFPGKDELWYQAIGPEGTVYKGGQRVDVPVNLTYTPVFYRAGAMVPRIHKVERSSTDSIKNPITLHAIVNVEGTNLSMSNLYIDDFTSFEYRDNKAFSYVHVHYDNNEQTLTITQRDDEANPSGFEPNIEQLVTHEISSNGVTSRTFKKTADGKLLSEVNLLELEKVILA